MQDREAMNDAHKFVGMLRNYLHLEKWEDYSLFIFGLLIVPAIFYSKSLITICYVGIFVSSLFRYRRNSKGQVRNRWILLFTLLLFYVVFSGYNSDNQDQCLMYLRIHLPFFLMPATFYLIGKLPRSWVVFFHVWLVIVLVLASIPVIITYLSDQSFYNNELLYGRPIPTPVEHVKYSMMNAYGVIASLLLLGKGIMKANRLPKIILAICGFWLFLFMHLLAVRTGILIAYISLLVLLLYTVRIALFSKRTIALGTVCVTALILVLWQVPTIQNKIRYVRYDLKMFQEGKGAFYADSDRLVSLRVGLSIFNENPVLGVGIGDLRDECENRYIQLYDRKERILLPHSQFLHVAASCGIVGLALFLLGFYGPFFLNSGMVKPFLFYLYLNFSVSFLLENSLERSMSVAFFLFFTLLSIQGWKMNQSKSGVNGSLPT